MLIASPANNPSPKPAAAPNRTNASPVLTPTRSRNGSPPTDRQLRGTLDDPKTSPNRPLRIVLMCDRRTEHPDHRIPDELLHRPAVALDQRPRHLRICRQHPIHILRIRTLRRSP